MTCPGKLALPWLDCTLLALLCRGGALRCALVIRGPAQFSAAAQPDIVRATQKDELYLQYLTDACLDAVRGLLGPRRAFLWIREVQLFCELLYHGLTTGAGLQTLGEEYCDILQVSGAGNVEPGAVRRGMLVLLQTVAPYIVEHLPSPGHALSLRMQPRFARMPPVESLIVSEDDDTLDSASGTTVPRPAAWQLGVQGAMSAREHGLLLWAWLSRHSHMLARLHLALFYFYGMYYAWPKRLTGVRFLFIGKLFERRPSYRVLGVLLCAQLAASASMQGLGGLAATWRARVLHGTSVPPASLDADKAALRPAVLLREDADEEQPCASGGLAHEAVPSPHSREVPPHKRCPLCLSARDTPTSTPCGHVFCWHCICEWGVQKPECPLCRAPFTPSSLICLHGSNF